MKAQTEIIGVVLIIVILVIGGLILITINMNKKKASAQTILDPKLADNFLFAILNTKTEKNIILADIIKDCYNNRNNICGTTTTSDCCIYAEKVLTNTLDATLGNWSRSYLLKIRRGNEERINDIPENSKCQGDYVEKEQTGTYYIPSTPPIIVTLDICKN